MAGKIKGWLQGWKQQQDDITQYGTVTLSQEQQTVTFRPVKSACVLFVACINGMWSSMIGPTLVNVEQLLDADTATMGLAMSLQSVGIMAGSFLSGFIYDRYNSELQLLLSVMMSGLSLVAMVWVSHIYSFFLIMIINGLALGYICTAECAYIMALWDGHRLKDTWVQALQMMAAVGCGISPYMIQPFLTDLHVFDGIMANGTMSAVSNYTTTFNSTTTVGSAMFDTATSQNRVWSADAQPGSTFEAYRREVGRVRYAYVLMGLFYMLSAVLFIILFLRNGVTLRKVEKVPGKRTSAQQSSSQRPPGYKIFFLVCLGLFYILYVYIESVPSAFISVYLVKELDMPVQYGVVVVSAFWLSLTISRIINIPFSFCVSPTIIVGFHLLVVMTSYMCILLLSGPNVILSCLIVAGLGLGPVFAAQMVWASRQIPFTGALASLCATTWAVGKISGFALTGYMIDEYGEISLLYITLTGSVTITLIFFIMVAVSKMCTAQTQTLSDRDDTVSKLCAAETQLSDAADDTASNNVDATQTLTRAERAPLLL